MRPVRAQDLTVLVAVSFLLMTIGGCMRSAASGQTAPNHSGESPLETDPTKGRDFRDISVHPNGEELLFTECIYDPKVEPTGDCYVLRYHLPTKSLYRYALPTDYVYKSASFSPHGHSIIMNRVPKIGISPDAVRQAHDQSEIAYMKVDGTRFRIVPLAKGNKVGPVMSDDETRVAYWRATLRPPGSKTFSSNFDVWEADLKTGYDQLFAGPFVFFERARLQYLSPDELLVGAYGPRAHAQSMTAYDKKYNSSSVYRIQRNLTKLPEPILTEVEYASFPSSDNARNLYFKGARPGIALFRKDLRGEIQQWGWPVRYGPGDWGGGGWHDLAAHPGGSFIAFVYEIKGTSARDAKRRLGLLMMQTSEWRDLNIPSLQSSQLIPVTTAESSSH